MNRRSFLLSLLSVVATAVIPPFLLRIASAQPSTSNVVPQQNKYGSHTDTSEEPQRPTTEVLHEVPIEPRPLRNMHGDTYCIHVSAGFGTGKSHLLTCESALDQTEIAISCNQSSFGKLRSD